MLLIQTVLSVSGLWPVPNLYCMHSTAHQAMRRLEAEVCTGIRIHERRGGFPGAVQAGDQLALRVPEKHADQIKPLSRYLHQSTAH